MSLAASTVRSGNVRWRFGRELRVARARLVQAALELYREIGNRSGEAVPLNSLGEILLATGQPGNARAQHTTALGLAEQISGKLQQARAHNGLGHAYQATGDIGKASDPWRMRL
jgi:hypothetical protein